MNKRRQTLKPLENKGFFCLSLLYRNGTPTPPSLFKAKLTSRRFPCHSDMQPSPSRSTPTDTSATICLKTRQTRWRNSSARCKKRRLTRIAVFRGYGKESVCGYGVGIQQHKKSRNPCISKDFGSWSIADSKRVTCFPLRPIMYHPEYIVHHPAQQFHSESHRIPPG